MSNYLENLKKKIKEMSNEDLLKRLICAVEIVAPEIRGLVIDPIMAKSIYKEIPLLRAEILSRLNMAKRNKTGLASPDDIQKELSECEIDKEFLKG